MTTLPILVMMIGPLSAISLAASSDQDGLGVLLGAGEAMDKPSRPPPAPKSQSAHNRS